MNPTLPSFSLALLAAGSIVTPALLAQAAEPWALVWGDEFEAAGAPDPERWGYDLGGGGWGNLEEQFYTNELENARVEDGRLVIEVQQVLGGRQPAYTSARLVTRDTFSFQYGRVEVRAKVPSETGTWAAIWLLSTDAIWDGAYWPYNGEIDIMEHVGYEEDPLFLAEINAESLPNIHSTLHTDARNTNNGIGETYSIPTASTQFHVYAMEWDARSIRMFVDDVLKAEFLRDRDAGIPLRNRPEDITPWWPFDQRFHLLLNIAVGGSWGGHFNTDIYPTSPYGSDGIDHDGVWPQRMEIDYVRVYQSAETVGLSHPLPGEFAASAFAAEQGNRLEPRVDDPADLVVHAIEEGDWLRYRVNVANAGRYTLSLQSMGGGSGMRLHNARTDTTVDLPNVPRSEDWQWHTALEIDLERGLNELTFTATGSGYKLGGLRIDAPVVGQWNGFPLDSAGNAQTGAWLGPIDASNSPFSFVPKLDSWLFFPALDGGTLSPNSQWIFSYAPTGMRIWDAADAPWYYAKATGTWFYAPESPDGLTTTPQWLYLFN